MLGLASPHSSSVSYLGLFEYNTSLPHAHLLIFFEFEITDPRSRIAVFCMQFVTCSQSIYMITVMIIITNSCSQNFTSRTGLFIASWLFIFLFQMCRALYRKLQVKVNHPRMQSIEL